MELLDRYVNAVGKHLPKKNRADIETEIRSTLEDMLADRSAKSGRPVDEAMVKELLKEYGAPEKVAATYLPERYLIGPRLFPLFWMVVRIVFVVLTTVGLVGMGIRIGMEPLPVENIVNTMGRTLLEYFQSLITALGNIVLVFAILERVLPEKEFKHLNPSDSKDWNPDQLMQEPSSDEVKLWEPVIVILFTFAGLILFNFYPQVIGVFINPKNMTMVPLLSEAFFRSYLPWLNLLWVLGIGLQVALLRLGRYTIPVHAFSIALRIGGVVLAGAMLSGPSLIGMTAGQLTAAGMEPTSAGVLVDLFTTFIKIALVIAVIAGTVDAIKEVVRMVTGSTHLSSLTFQK